MTDRILVIVLYNNKKIKKKPVAAFKVSLNFYM